MLAPNQTAGQELVPVLPPRYPTDRNAYNIEVTHLREQLAAAHAEIQYLKDLVAPPGLVFPVRWKLTNCESSLLRALVAAPGVMSKERLLVAMYDFEPSVEIKIVDVFVCKLRKKISKDGIVIETAWGAGYSLSPSVKGVVREASLAAAAGIDWVSPLGPVASPTERIRTELEARLAQVTVTVAGGRVPVRTLEGTWVQKRRDRETRGNAIATFRALHELTQSALAHMAGTRPEYVGIAEQGRGWDKLLASIEVAMVAYQPRREPSEHTETEDRGEHSGDRLLQPAGARSKRAPRTVHAAGRFGGRHGGGRARGQRSRAG